MSKLYNKYKELKQNSNSFEKKLYAFKSGVFFLFIDSDAKLVSSLLNLKLGKLNDEIVKCGFPVSSLEKYIRLLKCNGYEVEIIDINNNHSYSPNSYLRNNAIQNIVEDILRKDIDSLSISEAYDFLYYIQKELNFIMRGKKFE